MTRARSAALVALLLAACGSQSTTVSSGDANETTTAIEASADMAEDGNDPNASDLDYETVSTTTTTSDIDLDSPHDREPVPDATAGPATTISPTKSSASTASPATPNPTGGHVYIVTLENGFDASDLQEMLQGTSSMIIEELSELPIVIVRLDADGLTVLTGAPGVVAVEPDRLAEPTG